MRRNPFPFSRLPAGLCLLAGLAMLGGCGADRAPHRPPVDDPVIAAALAEQLMADPDLARINPVSAALTGGGPASAPMPVMDRSAETIAAARAEARQLAGGMVKPAPAPQPGGSPVGDLTAELTARAALLAVGLPADCAGGIGYGFIWAARLPAAVPVYPRGHAQEAAGTDAAPCRLRVVNFLSPVPLADIADFYWTRLRAAGFAPAHRLAGADHVILAARGAAVVAVSLREKDGLTEADLVTSGL